MTDNLSISDLCLLSNYVCHIDRLKGVEISSRFLDCARNDVLDLSTTLEVQSQNMTDNLSIENKEKGKTFYFVGGKHGWI